ncbi:MAG: pyruvate dehydrogenase complex dihydrolipoamide acetyltransferase [Deferrisomatales bacterium]
MAVEVTMPKLTDSMEEGHIVAWKVGVGDSVREGEALAEIETDKAVMELESFWEGTVAEIVFPAGSVVAVGTVIARIAERGAVAGAPERPPARTPPPPQPAEPPPAAPRAEEGPRSEPEPVRGGPEESSIPLPGGHPLAERGGRESPRPAPPAGASSEPGAPEGGPVRASPRARRLARERGVDLAAIQGTGPGGRVRGEDVERAAAPAGPQPKAAPAGAALGGPEEAPPVAFAPEEADVEEISFFQQAAIRRVVASQRTIPHFYLGGTVRADALLARKEAEKAASGATVTHLVLRACALALEQVPEANRSYDRGRWIRWKGIHLGLAVQTDAGLVVVVLRDAGGRDLGWIASRSRELVETARAGRLSPRERLHPTLTVSSLGAQGVERFAAIINPPSALTVAVGAARPAPVVEGGRVGVGRLMELTLSCDHRVVDGVLAARFLAALKQLLEDPTRL